MFLNSKIILHVFYIFCAFLYLSVPFIWRIFLTGPDGSMLDSWTPLSSSLTGIHPTTIFIYILPFAFFCLLAPFIKQNIFIRTPGFYPNIVPKISPIILTLIYVNFVMRGTGGVSLYSEDMVGEFPFYLLQFLSVALFLIIYSLLIYSNKEKIFSKISFVILMIGFIMSAIYPITAIMIRGTLDFNRYGSGPYYERYAGRLNLKPDNNTVKTAKISLWNTGGKMIVSTETITGSGRERGDKIVCTVRSTEPEKHILSGEKNATIPYLGGTAINYECSGEFISTGYLFPKSVYYKELPFVKKAYPLPQLRLENVQHPPVEISNRLW